MDWFVCWWHSSLPCGSQTPLYAAWAVTRAIGGPGDLRHDLILAGHVRGLEESAFRAELTALVHALRWARSSGFSVRLWSDCPGVVRGFRRLQSGQPLRRNRAHTDLWLQISDVLADWEGGVIKIVKVVSHCAVGGAQDPLEAWAWRQRWCGIVVCIEPSCGICCNKLDRQSWNKNQTLPRWRRQLRTQWNRWQWYRNSGQCQCAWSLARGPWTRPSWQNGGVQSVGKFWVVVGP